MRRALGLANALWGVRAALRSTSSSIVTAITVEAQPWATVVPASAHTHTLLSAACFSRLVHTARTTLQEENPCSAAAEAQRILRVCMHTKTRNPYLNTPAQTLSNTEFKDILTAESEVRPDMSYTEWADLCRSAGVAHTDDEVAAMLRSYSDAGVVLHFQERVYLQPKEIAESILSALRADFPASDDTSVGKLAMQLQELEERREVAITQAQKRTLWWMWGLAGAMVTQFGVFFYLTFVLEEEYGWDLVEPMTFFTFYSFGLASYLYFLLTRQEFTWERLHDRVFQHQLDKLATDHSFDAQQYEKLAKELRRHKHLLMRAAK